MGKIKHIFIQNRFYQALFFIAFVMVLGHFFNLAFIIGKIALFLFVALAICDIILLFQGTISVKREMAQRFSNGDENPVEYQARSTYSFTVKTKIIDELPDQFQARGFNQQTKLIQNTPFKFSINLRPVTRGLYTFGSIHVFAKTPLGLFTFRHTSKNTAVVKVYPSFLQLKRTELIAFSPNHDQKNSLKCQKPGNSKEFEQIKEYVVGDDYRKLNWKASARFNKLMVNEYQEERSRHIYQLIDMGRTMKMPFAGMALLDYAINSSLSVANVALKKQDKTGLITYSSKVHSIVKSNNQQLQLHHILETLYAQQTLFNESNLEQVFTMLEKNTQGRSLLIIYTNFESTPSLERQLPILKKLATRHLIMLVTFIDTELHNFTKKPANSVEQIYQKALANNHLLNKTLLLEKLTSFGIIHLKVKPNELTLAVINKYLEIKNRGMI